MIDVQPLQRASFESREKRLCDLLVGRLREQKRDVDVESILQQLPDRGKAFRRAGHLDHEIFAANSFPESARFFERALGVVGKVRRNLKTDVAVPSVRRLVNRLENVASVL